MRRSITGMLAFFVLFANFAWAADLDEVGGAPDEQVISLGGLDKPSGEQPGHDGLKNGSCDHCCHGSAHYVGFPTQPFSAVTSCGSDSPASWLTAYQSRANEPPLLPPKI